MLWKSFVLLVSFYLNQFLDLSKILTHELIKDFLFYSIFQIKMPHCLVLGCKSGSKRRKESTEQIFTTISLPKPPDIRLKWLEKINRLDYLTYSNQGRFMQS